MWMEAAWNWVAKTSIQVEMHCCFRICSFQLPKARVGRACVLLHLIFWLISKFFMSRKRLTKPCFATYNPSDRAGNGLLHGLILNPSHLSFIFLAPCATYLYCSCLVANSKHKYEKRLPEILSLFLALGSSSPCTPR